MSAKAKFGILIAVGAVAFAGAEAILRVEHFPSAYTAMFEPDAVIGYRHVRSTQLTISELHRHYDLRFDEDGIIDRSSDAAADVVILGDGVVAGVELPPPARLAARIVNRGCGRSAVNLAVTGYGPLQEELALERWISRHGAPKRVIVVHNLSNDLVDGVPQWEGGAMTPTVNRDGALVAPVLAPAFHRGMARLAKALRLYSWYQSSRISAPETAMAPQQRWLYEEHPPADLEEGLRVLAASYRRLAVLAAREHFTVEVIDWIDWDLVATADRAAAVSRANQRIAARSPWPLIAIGGLADRKDWSSRWLIAGTRHANAAATEEIVSAICEAGGR